MKTKRLICAALMAAMMLFATAQATSLERVWMEYEDYSGNRAEQSVEDAAVLEELEKMLMRAKEHPDEPDGGTQNCTLFCMTDAGDIYDFACSTDGSPLIQSGVNKGVYNLGVDYQRFWEIFSEVREGMGYDASEVFDW